jgi:hypothetical protein
MMKYPPQTDIAVLVLFFNRPEMLSRLFDRIRAARPSHLLLFQDGPRNDLDLPKMEACRAVVTDEQIDWECTVHRSYQTVNRGCDPSSFLSLKWAFSLYDKCVKLEDDDCPSLSFFPFCKEMLDRYEHDQRISLISGLNADEVTPDIPYDYFFTTTFSINGWATWRRVVDQWDEHYTFLDDAYNIHQLETLIKERRHPKDFLPSCRRHRASGKAYYETIFRTSMLLNNGLSIIPRVNMIANAGASDEGVHYSGSNELIPHALRRIFEMDCHELDFPLRHPRYVVENVEYKDRLYRTMGWGHPWIKAGRSLEELWLSLRHGQFCHIADALRRRFRL